MSQWARENPELCAEGVDAYDRYAEQADLLRKAQKEEGPPQPPAVKHPPVPGNPL